MNKSKRLVFFGNERLATGVATKAPVLSGLIAAGYDIAAVIVSHSEAKSRKKRTLEVAAVASNHNIPLVFSQNLKEQELLDLGATAGILAAFGQIVPQSLIDVFPCGIINVHPSLLPKYRGATPIESAILNNDRQTGVSLMQLVAKMDAGPLYGQVSLGLSGNETKQELSDELGSQGAKLLLTKLPSILDGRLKPKVQDNSEATYTKLINKIDGVIDCKKSAEQLGREIRAYAGWPKSRAEIFGKEVIVTQARPATNENDGDLLLPCSHGWLEIQQLVGPSGRNMTGADFIRGYRA